MLHHFTNNTRAKDEDTQTFVGMYYKVTQTWRKVESDAVGQRMLGLDAGTNLVVIVAARVPLAGIDEILVYLQLVKGEIIGEFFPPRLERLAQHLIVKTLDVETELAVVGQSHIVKVYRRIDKVDLGALHQAFDLHHNILARAYLSRGIHAAVQQLATEDDTPQHADSQSAG